LKTFKTEYIKPYILLYHELFEEFLINKQIPYWMTERMEDLKSKGLKIYEAIFEGKKEVEIDEIKYPIRKFSSGIKYVDLFGYRYIEQNRNKNSEWGKKAREGHKIMWIIKGRRYTAQILDGEYKELTKKS